MALNYYRYALEDIDVFLLEGGDNIIFETGIWDALNADTGYFALTGQDAILAYNRFLVAEYGSFALTGYDVDFSSWWTMIAETGYFTLTGLDIMLPTWWTKPADISTDWTKDDDISTDWDKRIKPTSN